MSLYNKILSYTHDHKETTDILETSYLMVTLYNEHTAKKMCQEYIDNLVSQIKYETLEVRRNKIIKRIKYYNILKYTLSQINKEKRLEKIKKIEKLNE